MTRRSPQQARRRGAASLALVHHANQYLVTDGYDDREGVSEVVEAYAAVLRLHAARAIPANLHLSGTLVEAAAWHCPWFLEEVAGLRRRGLVELVGGTYAENVMPLFGPDLNRRQLRELLWLYRRHLHCPAKAVKVCWTPERVWDTGRLAPLMADRALANGGYSAVLLDDRLLFPASAPDRSGHTPRSRFDATVAPEPGTVRAGSVPPAQARRAYRIAEGAGLVGLPIACDLRHRIPPGRPEDWLGLEAAVEAAVEETWEGGDLLLVYADDLEKTAGVGSWDPGHLGRYEELLDWLAARGDVTPVLLSTWLERRHTLAERPFERGTFVELARDWRAGDDYRGWWDAPGWAPYRRHLEDAAAALTSASEAGAAANLVELGWKHLLASTYETAWQEPVGRPAPWARALASHARACHVVAAAARWFGSDDRSPSARVLDLDLDGEDEAVLANEHLFAVLSPGRGGRLVYLFALVGGEGVCVVGNPCDDWNWQVELNRHMDRPANHPGALADWGFEHDHYAAEAGTGAGGAFVEMVDTEPSGPLAGARKLVTLGPRSRALAICYRWNDEVTGLAVVSCLSPDYLGLLREGRAGLSRVGTGRWRGARRDGVVVWQALATGEPTEWERPAHAESGHGLVVRARAHTPHFHLALGAAGAGPSKAELSTVGRACDCQTTELSPTP